MSVSLSLVTNYYLKTYINTFHYKAHHTMDGEYKKKMNEEEDKQFGVSLSLELSKNGKGFSGLMKSKLYFKSRNCW